MKHATSRISTQKKTLAGVTKIALLRRDTEKLSASAPRATVSLSASSENLETRKQEIYHGSNNSVVYPEH